MKATDACCASWPGMSDDAERFRKRAQDCRRLAKNAHYPQDRKTLGEMAAELDEEADRIDSEESGGRR